MEIGREHDGVAKRTIEQMVKNVVSNKLTETIDAVKKALAAYRKFPPSAKVAYYLHGAHQHATTVKPHSPVDLIVEITSVSGSNQGNDNPFADASFTYRSFRNHILECAREVFGNSLVKDGTNAIHIAGTPATMPANVLVCFKYTMVIKHGRDQVEKQGVAFYPKGSDQPVVNFPKQHHSYETVKDKGCQEQFLPMVRVFKNIRNRLLEMEYLLPGQAPSYFLESFISNAPSGMFTTDYAATIGSLLNFWEKNAWRNYLTIDGFRPLWGEAPQAWNMDEAAMFLDLIRKIGKQPEFWELATEF